MKRRKFLALLGFAPVVVPAVAEAMTAKPPEPAPAPPEVVINSGYFAQRLAAGTVPSDTLRREIERTAADIEGHMVPDVLYGNALWCGLSRDEMSALIEYRRRQLEDHRQRAGILSVLPELYGTPAVNPIFRVFGDNPDDAQRDLFKDRLRGSALYGKALAGDWQTDRLA